MDMGFQLKLNSGDFLMSQGEGGGRPPRWKTAAELEAAIQSYWDDCKANEKPIGLYGMYDFTNQDSSTFYEYESEAKDTKTEKFSAVCKKARIKVAAFAESKVYTNPAGAISQLVNVTKKLPEAYKNSQHQEVTGAGGKPIESKITVEYVNPPSIPHE